MDESDDRQSLGPQLDDLVTGESPPGPDMHHIIPA